MRVTDRRPLGRTSLDVTALGFGCAPIGGMFTSVSDDQAADALEAAWSVGIRFYDTAPLYGLGVAEERLGRMLAGKPRDEVVVATKVGRLIKPATEADASHDISAWVDNTTRVPVFDFSFEGVMRSFEDSLERLGLDRIDVVHIHDPDDYHDEAISGAYRALDRLRDQGVIGAVGAGMNQVEMLTRFAREADFDCFLVAGRYTLLERPAGAELLPLCEQRGIGVIAGGVFNSGLLADPKPGASYNYAPVDDATLARAQRLKAACDDARVSLKAAALQFPLRHQAASTVLTGARSASEVTENTALFEATVSDEIWSVLDGVP